MKKYQREIYYNPYRLPPRTFWKIDVKLTRSEAGKLCNGLHSLINELNGGAFYYPDIKAEKTVCRYEWQIVWDKIKFGIKLGITFIISKENLRHIDAYVAYGDESEKYGYEPSFSQDDLSTFYDEIITVIEEAIDRSTPERKKPYHTIFYVELPPFRRIAETIKLPEFGIIVFPTVILGKKSKRVSAIGITINESSQQTAKAIALQKIATVCALLTLARGRVYKTYIPEWPKNRKPIEFLESINQPIPLESLYPYRRWQSCMDNIDNDFGECLEKILMLYYSLSEHDRDNFIDSLLAYYAGKELFNSHPTLSVVALLAALSPFGKADKCPGKVNCSSCGELKFGNDNPFHHNLISDRDALVNSLCEIFKIEQKSDMHKELNYLITRTYQKQRSAFVHGAILRHGEYHQDYNLPASLPTTNQQYSDLFLYRRDLTSLEPLVRNALLILLSEKTGIPLDEKLFYLEKLKIYRDVVIESSISMPKNTIVYPSRDNFEKPIN